MPSSRNKPSAPVEEVYDINKLLRYECRGGKDFYLVEWKGYSPDEATWEPSENFIDPGPEIQSRMAELKKAAHTRKPTGEKRKSSKSSSSAAASEKVRTLLSSEEDDAGGSRAAAAEDEDDIGEAMTGERISQEAVTAVKRPRHETTRESNSSESLQQVGPPPAKRPSLETAQLPAPMVMYAPQRPAPLFAEAAPAGYDYVRSIRQDAALGICAIMTRSGADEEAGFKVPLDKIRHTHSQALIDFLVARIQFRNRL